MFLKRILQPDRRLLFSKYIVLAEEERLALVACAV